MLTLSLRGLDASSVVVGVEGGGEVPGEEDVEVGFYYANPAFPQMPTGIHFEISFASTETR